MIALMDNYAWLVDQVRRKEELKFAMIISGEQYVIMAGVMKRLGWSVDNWVFKQLVGGYIKDVCMCVSTFKSTGAVHFIYGSSYFGQGSGGIFLQNLACSGDELMLINCSHSGIGVHSCSHSEDAGAVCLGGKCEIYSPLAHVYKGYYHNIIYSIV